jgi:folate-binding protein YgfZ
MANSISTGPDYDAALWGAAAGFRLERRALTVTGKAPGDMLNGILSNSPPPPLSGEEGGVSQGIVRYSALLTHKGRVVTDLRWLRDPKDGFLLDLPHLGFEGALAHFRKFLPPRLAKVEDVSSHVSHLTLLGPELPSTLAKVWPKVGFPGSPEGMAELKEEEELVFPWTGSGTLRVSGNGDTHTNGWNLIIPAESAEALWKELDSAGAIPLTERTLTVLRVEKGRPAYGTDMDEETILLEAGIQGRAVDDTKGCYTGQEVVIRIRDRGHVNKELRGMLLGDAPLPRPGQELFAAGGEKSVGWITSAVASPAFRQNIALGYLKRSVSPGDRINLGEEDGPEAEVRALGDDGWVLD